MSRVLLVEDHACFRQSLGRMLSLETDFGASTQAGSLAEARACLSDGKAEGIDAAIVDIGLPDGDGRQLIREIEALRKSAHRIPVMALTVIQNLEFHERLRELGAEEVMSKASSMEEILAAARRLGTKGKVMNSELRVTDMAHAVLSRQARGRVERTGERFSDALVMVLQTEAGRRLGELRDGPFGDESAQQWQEDLPQKRAQERRQTQREERSRAFQEERSRVQLAAWKEFMQAERRELELRKDGQLAMLLGEPLLGEPPAAVLRLTSEDRRQAEEGLVALMHDGETFYKHLEELTERDMPARAAANRLRTTWLKDRQEDRW
jgi:DNA-binding NarL/FixJ family response regulator